MKVQEEILQPKLCSPAAKSKTTYERSSKKIKFISTGRKLLIINKHRSVCSICNKVFQNKTLLRRHRLSKCGLFRFKQCNICRKKFKTQERLDEHTATKCDTVKVFKCEFCNKMYMCKRQLDEHKTPICKSLRQFKCEVCHKSFPYQRIMLNHMTSVHGIGANPLKVFLCEICGKMYQRSHGLDHLRTHSEEKPYTCKKCEKCFKTRRALYSHCANHSASKLYTCAECKKCFKTLTILREHMSVHGMVTPAPKLQCKVCHKAFRRNRSLKAHIKTHEVLVQPKSEEKPHICNECGKSFNKRRNLTRHSVIHSDKKPFLCSQCDKAFRTSAMLKVHMSQQHKAQIQICTDIEQPNETNKNLYVCKHCGKGLSSSSSLKRHCLIHNVASEICNECGKNFTSNFSLRRHSLYYCGKKKFRCGNCKKVFMTSFLLNQHMSLHDLDTVSGIVKNESVPEPEEKPHICNECGQSFPTISSLDQHSLLHCENKDFPCDAYDGVNTNGFVLNQQMSLHKFDTDCGSIKNESLPQSEEKPHICQDCGKSFPTTSSLKEHSLFHSENKDFSCDAYGNRSTNNFHLDQKMTLHKFDTVSGIKNEFIPQLEEKLHTCQECGESFPTVSCLTQHSLLHCENKRFPCSSCDRVFMTSLLLNQHMSLHKLGPVSGNIISNSVPQPEIKPLICDECGKSFNRARNLKRHRLLHGTTTYVCNECGKGFKTITYLKRHSLRHTSNKSFPSDICSETFKTELSLRNHMSEHSFVSRTIKSEDNFLNESDNKPNVYKNDCGKTFMSTDDLNKPSITACEKLPPKCVVCQMTFSSVVGLSQHMVVHEGLDYSIGGKNFVDSDKTETHANTAIVKKDHSCNQCGKSFSSLNALNRHTVTHSEERPFICVICKSTFKRIDNLRNHVKRVHKVPPPISITNNTENVDKLIVPNQEVKEVQTYIDEKPCVNEFEPYINNEIGDMFQTLENLQQHFPVIDDTSFIQQPLDVYKSSFPSEENHGQNKFIQLVVIQVQNESYQ